MSDLISREAAIEAIDKNRQDLLSLGMGGAEHILVHYGRRVIEELPTINPVKHGEWIKLYAGNYKCSVCGDWWGNDDNEMVEDFKYCPNCGARLIGEEDA